MKSVIYNEILVEREDLSSLLFIQNSSQRGRFHTLLSLSSLFLNFKIFKKVISHFS